MKIIVDAYGGDHAPLEVIKGAVAARDAYGVDIVLVGNEEEIKKTATVYIAQGDTLKSLIV